MLMTALDHNYYYAVFLVKCYQLEHSINQDGKAADLSKRPRAEYATWLLTAFYSSRISATTWPNLPSDFILSNSSLID